MLLVFGCNGRHFADIVHSVAGSATAGDGEVKTIIFGEDLLFMKGEPDDNNSTG